MTELSPLAAGLRVDGLGEDNPVGVSAGTLILTLDGALPVEHLYPGDKVITRHGARALAEIAQLQLPAGTPIVSLTRNALGGRPERDMWLPAGQRILIRDWRAKALYGQAQACVPAAQLADGEYVRLAQLDAATTVFALTFGRPEVLYADGLELASADPLRVTA